MAPGWAMTAIAVVRRANGRRMRAGGVILRYYDGFLRWDKIGKLVLQELIDRKRYNVEDAFISILLGQRVEFKWSVSSAFYSASGYILLCQVLHLGQERLKSICALPLLLSLSSS